MQCRFRLDTVIVVAAMFATAMTASAADVTVSPASGSGFVVRNAANNADRLRVNEDGTILAPVVATGAQQATPVCSGVNGVLGPCAPGSGTAGPPGPPGPPGPAGTFTLPYSAAQGSTTPLFQVANTDTTKYTANGFKATSPAFAIVGVTTATTTDFSSFPGQVAGVRGESTGGANSAGVMGVSTNGAYGMFAQNAGGGTALTARQTGGATGTSVEAYSQNGTALNASSGGFYVLIANALGSTTDPAVFQASGSNVARIDHVGKGFFNGGTASSGADVAEFVPTTGATPQPGDVVEIDPIDEDHFRLAAEANSTRVAGVISTAPGVTLNDKTGATKATTGPALALAGRVPVKVTNANGAIRVGDLLVASNTSGHAMRAPGFPAPGSVIGKALQHFDGADGSIQMLVWMH